MLASDFVRFLLLTTLLVLPAILCEAWALIGQDDDSVALARLAAKVAEFLLTPIAAAAVALGVFQRLRGEPVQMRRCLDVVFENWVGLLGVAVLTRLAVGCGTVLLIVPGIVAFCTFFVAFPAMVVEDLGVFHACRRSWELTDGHRWSLFGVLLLGALGVASVSLPIFVAVTGEVAPELETLPLPLQLYSMVLGILVSTGGVVLTGVAYHDLRLLKDGIGEEDLAAVFA